MESKRKYYFLNIADTGNITRAAEQLLVSQPSLTQYLNKLEKELDIKLIDRSYTPLRLTEAGAIYYDYLKASLALDEEFNASLNNLKAQTASVLHIGIPAQVGYEVSQKIQPIITKYCPQVSFSIDEGTSKTVVDELLKGNIELGFFHNIKLESTEKLNIHPLTREKVIIVCNADNPILEGQVTTPSHPKLVSRKALMGQVFYQLGKKYILHDVAEEHMQKHGLSNVQRKYISELHSVMSIIIEHPESGIAYIPDYFVERSSNKSLARSLGFLSIEDDNITWDFSVGYKKNHPLSKNARSVLHSILDHYGDF